MTTNDETKEAKVEPMSTKGEPAMSKPSALWMIVPILLIALAVFLAR